MNHGPTPRPPSSRFLFDSVSGSAGFKWFSSSRGAWLELKYLHVLSFEFLVVSLVFELRLQSLQGPILFDEFVAKTCDLVLRVSPHLIQSGLEHIDPGGKTEILDREWTNEAIIISTNIAIQSEKWSLVQAGGGSEN